MIFVFMLVIRYVCFVRTLSCSIHSYRSGKVIFQESDLPLTNLAALFDIGHAPKDQSNRTIHLPCFAASEIHPVMELHVLQ